MSDARREILERFFIEEYGDNALTIKPNIAPGHGSCCTCKNCGYHYDDCNCGARIRVKYLDQALTALDEMDLTCEEIKRIIIDKELTPTVQEDSGQAEWSEGEAIKLAKAIHEAQQKKRGIK